MTLQKDLVAYREEFARKAPPGRVALYDEKVEELRAEFPLGLALAKGEVAPTFELPDVFGNPVSLIQALKSGPVVITFYRGGWCPYCNLQLRAYQRTLPAIKTLGAQLLAISPQNPDASLSTAEKNALEFSVLSDSGNQVARKFGLVYAMPEPLREALRANDKALPAVNGDDSWELPLTATYIIASDGRVALAFVDIDYRTRLEPNAIVECLESLLVGTSSKPDPAALKDSSTTDLSRGFPTSG